MDSQDYSRVTGKRGSICLLIRVDRLSQRPHRCRTWAPRGQTPIVQCNFSWKTLSVVAGLTLWNFYFRIYEGAISLLEAIFFMARMTL
jgi:hypothetical protein